MPRPDFAVALFHGPQAWGRPEGYILWSSFCRQASARFTPGELLQAEWKLRSGEGWTTLERDLTLVAAFPGSGAGVEILELLAAIAEKEDATVH